MKNLQERLQIYKEVRQDLIKADKEMGDVIPSIYLGLCSYFCHLGYINEVSSKELCIKFPGLLEAYKEMNLPDLIAPDKYSGYWFPMGDLSNRVRLLELAMDIIKGRLKKAAELFPSKDSIDAFVFACQKMKEATDSFSPKTNTTKQMEPFTIGGPGPLQKAFAEMAGFEIVKSFDFDHSFLYGTEYSKKLKRFHQRLIKKSLHFELPQQWNEAMAYTRRFYSQPEESEKGYFKFKREHDLSTRPTAPLMIADGITRPGDDRFSVLVIHPEYELEVIPNYYKKNTGIRFHKKQS
jgi:hypothetical protein